MFSVSVVIPTYNGRELLLANLPPLFDALARAERWEVIVVDDASRDDSVELLKTRFAAATVLVNEENRGFAETANRGLAAARNEIVLLLNNDVTVEADLFEKCLPRFADPRLFAVTPCVLDPGDRHQQAIFKLKPGYSWFYDTSLAEPPAEADIPLFFASGGSSFYHREKLVALGGGFSHLYSPFYVEDVDLSYHAWKRGWRCVMEPSTTVWHPVNSTIGKYNKRRKIKFLVARNKHLFMWANVTDPLLVFRYFLFLVPSLVWDVLSFRKYKLVGMFMALPRLGAALAERRRRKGGFTMTDRAVVEQVRL